MPDDGQYRLYILSCADGTLYTGIALDVRARLREHEQGVRGARYVRGRAPLKLEFEQKVGDRSRAQSMESRVKKLSRAKKLSLIDGSLALDTLI